MHAHIVSSKPIQEARKGVPVHACGWNHAWLDYITCAWLWCMTCMECMNDSGLWPFWHLLLGWTGWQWCRPRCIFYLRRWWGRWPPCLGNGRWPGRWWNNSAGSWQIWYHLRSWRHELVGRRGTWPIPSSWAGYWTKGWITPGFFGGKGGDWGLAEPLGTSGSGGTGSGGIGTAGSAASADTSATSAATAFGSAPLSPSASAALRRRSAGPGLEGMEGPFSCELPLRCLLLRRDKMDPNLSFGSRLYLAQIFL